MKLKLLFKIAKYAHSEPEAKPWAKITRDILLYKRAVDKQDIDNIAAQLELKANAYRFAMIAMSKYDPSLYYEEQLLRRWKKELISA